MISKNFYVKENLTKQFLFSDLRHYPRKSLSLSIRYSFHEVSAGEDLYSIAKKYFGKYGEMYWTTIADLNGIIKPDWIEVGQKLKIPNYIIENRIDLKIVYENNVSTAIKI